MLSVCLTSKSGLLIIYSVGQDFMDMPIFTVFALENKLLHLKGCKFRLNSKSLDFIK